MSNLTSSPVPTTPTASRPSTTPSGRRAGHLPEWVTLLLASRRAVVGLGIVAVFGLVAIVTPLVTHGSPNDMTALPNQAPSSAHWFGTTGQGQDVLLQTLWGARATLFIGFATGLAVMAIGAAIGMVGAYFGGWIDDLLSLMTNVFLIIPGLPLAVVVAAYLPSGTSTLIAVLVLTGWSWNARVLRGQTLSLRQKDFVAAAIVSGESSARIIFGEILPNMTSLLVSGFIGATVYAIGASVGLEFLGLGDVGEVTWGTNLYWATNNAALLTGSWWTIVPTGISVALVGFALTLVSSAIDTVTNPRLRAEQDATTLLRSVSIHPRAGIAKRRHGRATPVIKSGR